jgi:methyl coenzyme M reductase subunit C-like uncharacterized protein (methanogenesis marker protein 7)
MKGGIRKKIFNFQKFTKNIKKVSVKKWKLNKINRIPPSYKKNNKDVKTSAPEQK